MRYVVVFGCMVLAAEAGYSPNVRPDMDLGLFMLRIASRYDVPLPRSFQCQPMHAAEILMFLDDADSLDSVGMLSEQESCRLANIRKKISGERHLFAWEKPDWDVVGYGNLGLRGEVNPGYGDSAALHAKGTIAPRLGGAVGRFSFFSEIDVWTEYQSDTVFGVSAYQPYRGVPYNLYGRKGSSSVRASDLFRGGMSAGTRHARFDLCVDYMKQGPALYFPLTFSGAAPPLTFFRTQIEIGSVDYFHTFGLLRTQKDKRKYFYAHRLGVSLLNRCLLLGINEVIVNGSTADSAQSDPLRPEYYGEEHDWEWVYMIPFVPYTFAEHYLGDRDNALLSLDVEVLLPSMVRWYIEFFVDDISSPFTIFSDDFGNKWALTLGVQYFGTLLGKDLLALFEYSRIEPWVYTHFYGGSHRYTHFGRSLGSPMGPNSDALVLQAELAVSRRHSLGFVLRNSRKGVTRGSSVMHVYSDENDETKKVFLGPGHRTLTVGGLLWRMSPFGLFDITTHATVDSERDVSLVVEGGFRF